DRDHVEDGQIFRLRVLHVDLLDLFLEVFELQADEVGDRHLRLDLPGVGKEEALEVLGTLAAVFGGIQVLRLLRRLHVAALDPVFGDQLGGDRAALALGDRHRDDAGLRLFLRFRFLGELVDRVAVAHVLLHLEAAREEVGALARQGDAGLEQGRAGDDEAAGDDALLFQQVADFADARALRDLHRDVPAPVTVERLEERVEEEQDEDRDDHGDDPERVAQERAEDPAAPTAVIAVATALARRAGHFRIALVVEVMVVEPVVVARGRRLPVAGAGLLRRPGRQRAAFAGGLAGDGAARGRLVGVATRRGRGAGPWIRLGRIRGRPVLGFRQRRDRLFFGRFGHRLFGGRRAGVGDGLFARRGSRLFRPRRFSRRWRRR